MIRELLIASGFSELGGAKKRKLFSILLVLGCFGTLTFSTQGLRERRSDEALERGSQVARQVYDRIARGDLAHATAPGMGAQARSAPSRNPNGASAGSGLLPLTSTAYLAFDQSGVPCFGDFSAECGPIGPGDDIAVPFARKNVFIGNSVEWNLLIETNSFSGPFTVIVFAFEAGFLGVTDFDFYTGDAVADSVMIVSFPGKTVFGPAGGAFLYAFVGDDMGNEMSRALYGYTVN